jgi:hypothetical protein
MNMPPPLSGLSLAEISLPGASTVEAIIWTLKNQLGLERHGGCVPAGLRARIVQRLLALNAAIWFNWQIDAPVKRSLIACDHA